MSMTMGQILAEAKSLAPQQREAIAEALLIDVDEADQDEVDAAWAEEIDRRLAAYDRGEVQAVPPAEMFRRIREKYVR